MKDKLTKKRIKVDYDRMICYLKLDSEFVRYMFSNKSKISTRRMALAFLRGKKVDVQSVYYEMKEKGLIIDNDNSPINEFKFDDVPDMVRRCDEISSDKEGCTIDNSRFY